KMNSLTDKEMIDKLCEVGRCGVKVNLIVRGICCLVAGIPGVTDNVNVISVVGRFLEHSRVYCFGEGEEMTTYISSADLMTRNTDRRVEIATPVLDKDIRERIYNILQTILADNVNARKMLPDGSYTKVENDNPPLDSQNYFLIN
ncbi:MAG: RNA degradosome polyphosphate kinase, partial [Candidatus Coproplasma sp.]